MAKKSSNASNSKLLKFSRQSTQQSVNNKENKESNQQKLITTSTSLGHVLAMIIMGIKSDQK
jgi:flagellar biogenesis protein FliO